MKKILLLLSVTLLTVAAATAQCVPDPQYTTPGIYPDSATGFAPACEGDLYEQVITNVVPVDTNVEIIPGFPVTLAFDSIVIVSFTGLPASMTYACATSLGGCSFAGGEAGCVIISGTPTAGEVGIHPLNITVDVYVGGLGTSSSTQDIDWYFIEVQSAGTCTGGIAEGNISGVSLYPNPTENILTVDGLNANTENITITNMSGQVMNVFNSITGSSMELNVEHLDSGIYFVNINGDASQVIRFVKK